MPVMVCGAYFCILLGPLIEPSRKWNKKNVILCVVDEASPALTNANNNEITFLTAQEIDADNCV